MFAEGSYNTFVGSFAGQYNTASDNTFIGQSAGNFNTSETRTFTVDTTKPSVTLNYPDNSVTTSNTSFNFNWTARNGIDTVLSCNLSIDGAVNKSNVASPNNTPTNYSVSGFGEGSHLWNVTCIDDASNTNTSETRSFTIDTIYPVVTIQAPINSNYRNTTLDLNFTVSEANIDKCWYINVTGQNLPLASCNNATFTALQGNNNITVYANDSANNINFSN
jgi:hypothetical protein